ncbi:MAG: hypothetical protein F6K10_40065 [Moorea sp. SIO2B7]|nr:hypothetical protein [Moorena sp. SIO2B7]
MTRSILRDSYLRHTSQQEQKLYDHLLYCVQTQSPKQLLNHFHGLFIKGSLPCDSDIRTAIETIVNAKNAQEEFKYILNRCCHIIINRWQIQSHLQGSIPELVALFEDIRSPIFSACRTSRHLRHLVHDFIKTDQYKTLQRLARVINQTKQTKENSTKSVGNLINRYPYLYEHCLLSEDSSYEHQQTVRQIQRQMQHNFELDISQYVTYQVRLAQLARQKRSVQKAQQIIQRVENPTLLSERELAAALKEFIGKVQGNYTYRDLSQNFLIGVTQTSSYQKFKDDLYEYLISSIDDKYGNYQFNQKLYQRIQNTMPQCDNQKPNEFLILRTSSQLLNFLIVESNQRPQHYIFVDMITNLGPISTVGLLLKLVLLCRKVKPSLEKRFSILFNHYESHAKDGVPWLIQSLENLHVAFSVHFGSADVSCLKQIMR